MNNIKTYKDSKELPFYNYKRIIQTGDFLYMIKGYDGEEYPEVDLENLKTDFDSITEDYVLSINSKSEDIVKYSRILSATNEINKLSIIIDFINHKQKCNNIREALGLEIDNSEIYDLLSLIKVQKSDDLEVQKTYLESKIQKYKNDIAKEESGLKKIQSNNDSEDSDLDEQFMSVCLGLEMHVDEKKISLYQYGVMVKLLIKKVESLNKINKK